MLGASILRRRSICIHSSRKTPSRTRLCLVKPSEIFPLSFGRETHPHCVGHSGPRGPNTQDETQQIMAESGHLFEDMMATCHSPGVLERRLENHPEVGNSDNLKRISSAMDIVHTLIQMVRKGFTASYVSVSSPTLCMKRFEARARLLCVVAVATLRGRRSPIQRNVFRP